MKNPYLKFSGQELGFSKVTSAMGGIKKRRTFYTVIAKNLGLIR